MLGQIARDVQHAARAIRRMPGVAAVVVLSLGVGIGVNTAVFTWIQARVLKPLPAVPRGGSLQLVEPRTETGAFPGTSWLEARDLAARLPAFQEILAFRMAPMNVGAAAWSERTYGMLVSGNYFRALEVEAAAGRVIGDGDAVRAGGEPEVVISHEFWQTRYAGSLDAVGSVLRVNDRPLTVVGVAARGFRGTIMGLTFDLWVPMTLAPVLSPGSRELDSRSARGVSAMGQLRAGVSRAQAGLELAAALQELARAYPATNERLTGEVLPFWQSPRGPQRSMIGALAVLQAVMLLVLLAVCGNMATLVLARSSARTHEVAVRLALGAGRARVISLMLCETLLLAVGGVVIGSVFAVWGTEIMRAVPMPTPAGLQIRFDTDVDLLSLVFATLLGIGGGLVIGLVPALQLSRVAPQWSARAGRAAPGKSVMRDGLMAVQAGLALVVLVIAAIFLQRFQDTQSTDPGFTREGVLLGTYDLRGRSRPTDGLSSGDFARRLLERVRALPAVEAAAIASAVPLDIHGLPTRVFNLEGFPRTDAGFNQALSLTVTPGYFETMAIPIVLGRDFAAMDDATAAPSAIVNEAFVKRYVPSAVVIGRRLEIAGAPYAIAGVARDSLYNAYGEPPTPVVYLSFRDRPQTLGEVHLRTRPGAEASLAPDLRRILRDLDPTLPLYNVRTLTDHVESNLVFQRIPARLFVVIGPLVLVLVAVGIYAVVSYTVTERRLDISIRLALGARTRLVIAELVWRTLRVVGVGLAGGWAIAFLIDREIGASDAASSLAFAMVPALLTGVAALASWWPARRASAIDPIHALKLE